MNRLDLNKSVHLHKSVALKIRHLLTEIGDMDTPGEIREDVQTEIVDELHYVASYCERMAKHDSDQAELQSYDSDIEADAQQERMA